MSSFLYRLGRFAFRRRWAVIIAAVLFTGLLGGVVAVAGGTMDDAFTIPGTESQEGLDRLATRFPQASGASASVIVGVPTGQTVESTASRAALKALRKRLEDVPQVSSVSNPFGKNPVGPTDKGAQISTDHRYAVVSVTFEGEGVADVEDSSIAALEKAARADLPSGVTVTLGGEVFAEQGGEAGGLGEVVGVAVALLVLMLTFGSFLAAGMPLLTAVLGVGLTMLSVYVAAAITTISSTAPTLALMIGLALGIDYALFIISRHREQLRTGLDPEESVARALATAGSAVVFAGTTVVIALLGLMIAQIPFLSVMGIAAAGSVVFAVVIALTVLPAMLALAGERMRPRVRGARRGRAARRAAAGDTATTPATDAAPTSPATAAPAGAAETARPDGPRTEPLPLQRRRPEAGAAVPATPAEPEPARPARRRPSERWVRAVTKIPALTIVLVVLALGTLALPARDLRLALPDSGTAAKGTPARETYDLMTREFGAGYTSPLLLTVDIVANDDPLDALDGLTDRLRTLAHVHSIELAVPNENADMGVIMVIPDASSSDQSTADLVADIRAHRDQWQRDLDVRDLTVTGATAIQIDVSSQLSRSLLPFGVVVVGLALVLLMIVFRSIAVPVKASVGFVLSVLSAFGAVSLIFEHGWFIGLLGIEKTGPVISFMPILVMGILFGLAMDYEVFLVSRMREEHAHGAAPLDAIHRGFAGSALVVSAAAVIMVTVFGAFVPGGTSTIKAIGLALAVGVFVDAFIVRMTLVPAVMALLGRWAWWLPRWLDQRLPHLDIEGEALVYHLEHARWTAAHGEAAVRVEGLIHAAHGDREGGPGPVDLVARTGDLVLVTGGSPQDRRAVLSTVGGLLSPLAGRVVVGGRLVPEEAGGVRSRVAPVEPFTDDELDGVKAVDLVRSGLAGAVITRAVRASSLLRSLSVDPSAPAESLTALQRHLVAVRMALSASPQVLTVHEDHRLVSPHDRSAALRYLAEIAAAGTTVLVAGLAPEEAAQVLPAGSCSVCRLGAPRGARSLEVSH